MAPWSKNGEYDEDGKIIDPQLYGNGDVRG